jgi:hypothetical protein
VKLAESLLDSGLAATVQHGFGTFFPKPPELQVLCDNWVKIRPELATIDLDSYKGYSQIQSFAPKSRLNVRRTTLLHPVDFVLYTSLVLALKPHISAARLPADRVFSHRAEGTERRAPIRIPSIAPPHRGRISELPFGPGLKSGPLDSSALLT